jgi:hypothetical protein
VIGQLYTPAALPPAKEPRYLLNRSPRTSLDNTEKRKFLILPQTIRRFFNVFSFGVGHLVASLDEELYYNQRVADLIPVDIGLFNWPNPSTRTLALVSTQPLMSTINLLVVKGLQASKVDKHRHL